MSGKRPKSVDIAGYKWKIIWLDNDAWVANEKLDDGHSGESWGHSLEIYVRVVPGQIKEVVREVFFHELLHACLATTGHCFLPRFLKKGDWEEVMVSGLSPALLAVLRTNPQVSTYLFG